MPAAPERRRRPGRLLGLLVWASLFALIGFIYLYYASLSEAFSSFDAESSSISLTGLPGNTVGFSLTGNSVGSFWASTSGLSLQLADHSSGFSKTFAVTPAQPESWGKTITVCEGGVCSGDAYSDGGFTIPAKFTISSSLADSVDRTLNGTLTGELSYPESTGDGSFMNNDTQVDIPVTLKLAATSKLAHDSAVLGVLISACVFVAAMTGLVRGARPGERSQDQRDMVLAAVRKHRRSTATRISKQLRMPRDSVSSQLGELERRGLVTRKIAEAVTWWYPAETTSVPDAEANKAK